jgi:carboxymethylenebutenolidase
VRRAFIGGAGRVNRRIIKLNEDYADKPLQRRVFLQRLTALAGSSAAAMALLPMLGSSDARAAVDPADPRIQSETISYPGATGLVRALLVRPQGVEGRLPAVIVIHDDRGLTRHIEDVTRRMALEGFVALAPDLLSPLGGTPGNERRARDRFARLSRLQTIANGVAAMVYLKRRSDVSGKVGATGFGWGGGIVNQLAVNSPDVTAAAPFYGEQPEAPDVPRIRAKMLLHYAGKDERINAGIAAFEAALEVSNILFVKYQYENTQHAFHDDTAGVRYNKAAAELAWKRTIEFLKESLKSA